MSASQLRLPYHIRSDILLRTENVELCGNLGYVYEAVKLLLFYELNDGEPRAICGDWALKYLPEDMKLHVALYANNVYFTNDNKLLFDNFMTVLRNRDRRQTHWNSYLFMDWLHQQKKCPLLVHKSTDILAYIHQKYKGPENRNRLFKNPDVWEIRMEYILERYCAIHSAKEKKQVEVANDLEDSFYP